MRPARGLVIVEAVETEETMPGGLIVLPEASRERMAMGQMIVTAIGEPELCPDIEACHRSHETLHTRTPNDKHTHQTDPRISQGAWVLVKHRALQTAIPDTRPTQYIARIHDIQALFTQSARPLANCKSTTTS